MSEEYFDKEIAPRLKEVGNICVKKGIPFLAVVEYTPGNIGRTEFSANDECIEMVMIRHCAKTAPNIDAFVIGLKRWAKEKGIDYSNSIVMRPFIET